MSRNRILTRPTKISELTFEDLYEDISRDWEHKAQALQARRWHALRREMKGGQL